MRRKKEDVNIEVLERKITKQKQAIWKDIFLHRSVWQAGKISTNRKPVEDRAWKTIVRLADKWKKEHEPQT